MRAWRANGYGGDVTATTDSLPNRDRRGFLRGSPTAFQLAQYSYFALIVLLAWMKTPITIGGLDVFPVDAAFGVTMLLWLLALARRETTLRLHPAFWLLLFYFAAMGLSLFNSDDVQRSAVKLLTQLYLLALPVLTYNLVSTVGDMRRVFASWLGGAAAVSLLGVATVLLFPFLGYQSVLSWPLHNFGTLPPGNYPRLELTFLFPAMLANYLGVSLAMVFVSGWLGWVGRRAVLAMASAILLSAFFGLTPGFGSVLFVLGACTWYSQRERRPGLARAALVVGSAMPIIGALLASVTPILHPTAPFLVQIPGLPAPLAPSVRLLAWIDAVHNFLASPILGQGIGLDTVDVDYEASGCSTSCVTEAHNTFLNFAVQCGIVGLAALAALIWFVARHIKRPPPQSQANVLLFGLSIAWLSGFALHGLVGSFEDTRHLWIVLGLILSASSLRTATAKT